MAPSPQSDVLPEALRRFATQRHATIVADYDHSIASGDDPRVRLPEHGAAETFQTFAALPNTGAVILTGRGNHEIVDLLGRSSARFAPGTLKFTVDDAQGHIYVIGRHGLASDPELGGTGQVELDPNQERRRSRLHAELPAALRERFPDVELIVEDQATEYLTGSDLRKNDPGTKPANSVTLALTENGAVLHTEWFDDQHREVGEQVRAYFNEQVERNVEAWGALHRKSGKNIDELTILKPNKGLGIERVRQRRGGPILFVGDDITDVDAIEALDPEAGDVALVVGDKIHDELSRRGLADRGNIAYAADPAEAVGMLRAVAEERAAHLGYSSRARRLLRTAHTVRGLPTPRPAVVTSPSGPVADRAPVGRRSQPHAFSPSRDRMSRGGMRA